METLINFYRDLEPIFRSLTLIPHWLLGIIIYLILFLSCLSVMLRNSGTEKIVLSNEQSTKNLILAGQYYWPKESKEADIAELLGHFGLSSPPKKYFGRKNKVEFFKFNYSNPPSDIKNHLKSFAFRQGTFLDLLHYGIKYPNAQRELTIVATDCIICHGRIYFFPVLTSDQHGRRVLRIVEASSYADIFAAANRFMVFSE